MTPQVSRSALKAVVVIGLLEMLAAVAWVYCR